MSNTYSRHAHPCLCFQEQQQGLRCACLSVAVHLLHTHAMGPKLVDRELQGLRHACMSAAVPVRHTHARKPT